MCEKSYIYYIYSNPLPPFGALGVVDIILRIPIPVNQLEFLPYYIAAAKLQHTRCVPCYVNHC